VVCIKCSIKLVKIMSMEIIGINAYNATNQLPDDVLLVIFDRLDDEDLLRCETVCRQWRNVLLSGRPWKTLFRRQIVSSDLWRRVLRNFGVGVDNLETVHYRGLCRAICRQIKETDRNWRAGNFKIGADEILEADKVVTLEDDCVVYKFCRMFPSPITLTFFDRRSFKFTGATRIPAMSFAVTNAQIVVVWNLRNINILDTNDQKISDLPELDENERIFWSLTSCCLSRDQMAVLSQTDGRGKLSLWDVSDPLRVTWLKSRYFSLDLQFELKLAMKMDEQFIAISTFQEESTRFCFFSKKSLSLHLLKTVDGNMKKNFAYGQGLMLFYFSKKNDKYEEYGIIQIYGVKSRKCFHEIRFTTEHNFEELDRNVGFNSKFMVIAHRKESEQPNQMNIYDLDAIKNPNSNELLVHTVAVEFDFDRIVVTETEILCRDLEKIQTLDFGFFELFRNEAKTVTLSLPWRSVWRSKGADEEPLEPAHHMEVYAEVLKYFHQLDMNCKMALKCYPVVDPDVASFNLGDDFIGYRQRNPKMDEMSEEMESKTVQISKNTEVSVNGKTIQLISVATGNVINEIKLTRNPIHFHFGSNLLVFVSQIAEHEHVLRVWRVEHFLNFIHIKDVAIEDYYCSYDEYEDWLQVDQHFIAVHTPIEDGGNTYNFISLKTFQVERSLSYDHFSFEGFYDGGYLFLIKKSGFVRMLDVVSGTFLHDIRIGPYAFHRIIVRVNSNYVVLAAVESQSNSDSSGKSKLYIYELKYLKEIDTVPTHLLLTRIDLYCEVVAMRMTETRLVCLSKTNMYVVNLKPINRLRCPEPSFY
jgi:F-box-like